MPYDSTLAATPAPPPPLEDVPKPIAHWLHTVALFAILLLTASASHSRAAEIGANAPARIPRYVQTMMLEVLLVGAVIAGIYRRREFFLGAFMSRATTLAQSLALGVGVYFAGLFAIAAVGGALYNTRLRNERNLDVVLAMAPRTALEFTLWFGVSLSAGLCEELIFRGYLQQQFTAWTRSPIAAIFLTAALFGSVHLYEGFAAIFSLAALALVYGFVVHYSKRDLRAVIVAHTLQDFLVAFIILAKPHLEHVQQQLKH